MTSIHDLNIVPNQPFKNPNGSDSYYCKFCHSYSANFYKSAIREHYSRCRACHKKTLDKKKSELSPTDRLVKKLKHNLIQKNQHQLARSLKPEHIAKILKNEGIFDDQVDKVKTITCSHDPTHDIWKFNVHIMQTGK